MEKERGEQTGVGSKARLIEQIGKSLDSGNYSHVLDLVRDTAPEFPDDVELLALQNLARDGLKRSAQAQGFISDSQQLFAQRKPTEAIQLLQKAYELDKTNSLARTILANALVEHAHSLVETDWLEAETLTNQALRLNPVHPTAKTVLNLIVEQKETSSSEDWVAQAHKLQSSGDLFAALAWVAEGLAVHPHDPKLLQIQDTIQRDQSVRRRQTRRVDLEELRRLGVEIDTAEGITAKRALAERIQAVAAKYWTDGEMLSLANSLLHRLGLAPQENSAAPLHNKTATVIFHVPRAGSPKAPNADAIEIPPAPVPSRTVQNAANPPSLAVPASKASPGPLPVDNVPTTRPELLVPPPPVEAAVPDFAPSTVTTASPRPEQPPRSSATTLMLICAAASIILVAATFFFTRRHYAPAITKNSLPPVVSAPLVDRSSPAPVTAPAASPPEPTAPETPSSALPISSDTAGGGVMPSERQTGESGDNEGTLVIVAGENNARVFLDGQLQPQLTEAGRVRFPNLEVRDYVVRVTKSGFRDPPQQTVRIRRGKQAVLVFNLQPESDTQPQPQPSLASLTIRGGAPGTAVLIDQVPVGTIQQDGTFTLSTVSPGDHSIELRKERFLPRQFKEHFIMGGAVSLTAADTLLAAAPGELKITFAPADSKVAIVRDNSLTIVRSGVPLNLSAGTYTLTARTPDRFTRSSTVEVLSGQSRSFDLSLAPAGMSQWDDPSAWKQEKDSFVHKGGNFVLYNVVPASGTFVFSAMLVKGRLLQWVLNYNDPKNYILFQLDDDNLYRAVVRNGQKTDETKVPEKGDRKSPRALHIRVSPTELVHEIKNGDSWTVIDRCAQPGVNLSSGKFGFYIPGNDEVALSEFAHYSDLNLR